VTAGTLALCPPYRLRLENPKENSLGPKNPVDKQ
jgi:hypothetical protein